MTYQLTTLSNGLRVASESLPGVESVAVNVTVDAGARHESEPENGISHLLEHMAFKGTQTRNARQIAEAFDDIGGQVNAWTSMEHTSYFGKVLKHDLRTAMEIIADILQHSLFNEAELAREQDVIIQEIAAHHDTPEDLIADYFDGAAYPGQPLGRSILGTEELVSSHTSERLFAYMRKHYAPARMALSAAGNVDHAELVACAQEFFAMPPGNGDHTPQAAHYRGGASMVARDIEQMHLMIGLPGAAVHDADYYAVQLYASILGGGMSSRLFQEVREKRGLAYTVFASSSSYADCGLMSVYASASPEQAQQLCTVLCDQVRAMADGVTDAEIRRAKQQHKAELLMARESPQAVSGWIGRHLLTFGQYRPASEIAARIDAVTREDVARVAAGLLRSPPTVAALGDTINMLAYDTIEARLSGG